MGATPDVRVDAQGQPFFLATEPVFPAPLLAQILEGEWARKYFSQLILEG